LADISIPGAGSSSTWLDRPALSSRLRIAAVSWNWEVVAYVSLVAIALVLRVWGTGDRALHHDESLHAYFAWKLFVGQGYQYDPLMHGPLQFEVVPLFYVLFGDNEFSARLLAVVLGTVLVGLPFFLRPYIGRAGALSGAFVLAISPAFVYFSRFIRDDMYLACFTLAMVICIVKYIDSQRPMFMYVLFTCAALALASMEAAYLEFFILGTFLIFQGLHEYMQRRDGPLLTALRNTSLDTWLTAISLFIIITVVCYSTFFTNPYGIWDTRHSFMSPLRRDVLGGLLYWKEQHTVQRGGQPWFYYLLVLPLYEQVAVVFGCIGIAYACVRRTFARSLLVWWAVMSVCLYSWAGEKMPWLSIHIALPMTLLAGLAVQELARTARRHILPVALTSFALLCALELHATFELNFADAADPREMLIYVQTSQDVPNVVHEIATLSKRVTKGNRLQIGVDSNDVGGWPFTWYLRSYPNVTQSQNFGGPVCSGHYCPVLLMLGPEYDQYSSQILRRYVVQKYRWNWWFPEDYKQWFPQHVFAPLTGPASSVDRFGTRNDWLHVWDWLIYRRPFGDRGARFLYFAVRRDLVAGSKEFGKSTLAAPSSGGKLPALGASSAGAFGQSGSSQLGSPRAIAADKGGNLYVADALNHRIVEYTSTGAEIRSWGSAGSAPGQFAQRDSPQGVTVGPDGKVYVADTWNQRVQVFTATGKYVRMWGGGAIGAAPKQFFGPRAISVGPSGTVYVADTGNKRIQEYSRLGRYLGSFGTAGSAPGQFNEPSSVAAASDGRVYVADFWNQRVQVFTSTGAFLRTWPMTDWVPQSYDEPYISARPDARRIFVSDPQQQQVVEFTSDGKLVGSFGRSNLSLPIGVAAASGNKVAVTDGTTHSVQLFAVRGIEGRMQQSTVGSPPKRP